MNYTFGGCLLPNIVNLQSQHVKMVTRDDVRKATASCIYDSLDILWHFLLKLWTMITQINSAAAFLLNWWCTLCQSMDTIWHHANTSLWPVGRSPNVAISLGTLWQTFGFLCAPYLALFKGWSTSGHLIAPSRYQMIS